MEQGTTLTRKDFKSKVTPEKIGLLMYGIYTKLKITDRLGLNKMLIDVDVPITPMAQVLKECKIIENTGGTGMGASWKWLPSSPPNDVLILRVETAYRSLVNAYQQEMQARKDKYNGVNRNESGPAHVQPKTDSKPSLYITERLEALEDRERHIIDLLETLCSNLGLTETLGGRKIG